MKIQQSHWSPTSGWDRPCTLVGNGTTALVFVFGSLALIEREEAIADVRRWYPNAHVVGCTTAGEISGTRVRDDALSFTAIDFEHTQIRIAETDLHGSQSSKAAGKQLAQALKGTDLQHVMILSEGLHVNGSELVLGLAEALPSGISVTGGLAGDGAQFNQTYVHLDGHNKSDRLVAIGFYGTRLRVGFSSRGGWDPFGPERVVTRSSGNVLYELDGESALGLYERYLGEHASGLPASALRFPLAIRTGQNSLPVVRTILGINREDQSMTFAGDIPTGAYARLMRGDIDHLTEGASAAARIAHAALLERPAELAILISCAGRRLVLKQRVEEEVEAVRDVVGGATVMTGFYSHGEICPFGPFGESALHNQTMTVTTFSEAA